MAEHPMETTLRTALWRQFGAAIDMLENALLACPSALWNERLWSDQEATGLPNLLVSHLSHPLLARPVSHRLNRSIRSPCALQEPVWTPQVHFPNSPIPGMSSTPI